MLILSLLAVVLLGNLATSLMKMNSIVEYTNGSYDTSSSYHPRQMVSRLPDGYYSYTEDYTNE